MADTCYLGDDFDIIFPPVQDVDGDVIDLTGAQVFCDAKTGSSSPVAADAFFIDDGPAGLCRVRFRSATTGAFAPSSSYTYDGRVKLGDGSLHTIGFGSFRAVAPVTPTP